MRYDSTMSNTPYQPVFAPHSSPPEQRDTQFYTPETEHLRLDDDNLPPAQPRFMGADHSEFRGSFASSNPTLAGDYPANDSSIALNKPGYYNYTDADVDGAEPRQSRSYGTSPYLNEKAAYAPKKSRKRAILIGALVAAAVIIAAVVAVYFAVIKPKQDKNSTTSSSSSGSSADNSDGASSNGSTGTKSTLAVTGVDGSKVTLDDGSTMTYQNSFGGTWYYDPENVLVSGARPNSWTPALNETFKFGEDIIRGSVACLLASAANRCS